MTLDGTVPQEVSQEEIDQRKLRGASWLADRAKAEDAREEDARRIKVYQGKREALEMKRETKYANSSDDDKVKYDKWMEDRQASFDNQDNEELERGRTVSTFRSNFMAKHSLSIAQLRVIDCLPNGSMAEEEWIVKGRQKPYVIFKMSRQRMRAAPGDLLASMASQAQGGIVGMTVEITLENTKTVIVDRPEGVPLDAIPYNHNGSWSWHKKPEGDVMPAKESERDHNCQTCGKTGFAATAGNAMMTGVGDDRGLNQFTLMECILATTLRVYFKGYIGTIRVYNK